MPMMRFLLRRRGFVTVSVSSGGVLASISFAAGLATRRAFLVAIATPNPDRTRIIERGRFAPGEMPWRAPCPERALESRSWHRAKLAHPRCCAAVTPLMAAVRVAAAAAERCPRRASGARRKHGAKVLALRLAGT
jgi:hypothetical protein